MIGLLETNVLSIPLLLKSKKKAKYLKFSTFQSKIYLLFGRGPPLQVENVR